MVRLIPIQVECYAGYRGDESPRALVLNGQRRDIEEIVDRWYQAGRDPSVAASDYYRVRTADGSLLLIRLDRDAQAWHLVEEARG